MPHERNILSVVHQEVPGGIPGPDLPGSGPRTRPDPTQGGQENRPFWHILGPSQGFSSQARHPVAPWKTATIGVKAQFGNVAFSRGPYPWEGFSTLFRGPG